MRSNQLKNCNPFFVNEPIDIKWIMLLSFGLFFIFELMISTPFGIDIILSLPTSFKK